MRTLLRIVGYCVWLCFMGNARAMSSSSEAGPFAPNPACASSSGHAGPSGLSGAFVPAVAEDCPICFYPMDTNLPPEDDSAPVNGHILFSCDARHKFHAKCIVGWFAKSGSESCPLCRGFGQRPDPKLEKNGVLYLQVAYHCLCACKNSDAVNVVYRHQMFLRASWAAYLNVVRYSVEHGVDVNLEDRQSRTALMLAAGSGSLSTVLYLVEHGARTDPRTCSDLRAIDFAAGRGFLPVVQYLSQFPMNEYEKRCAVESAARFGHMPIVVWLVPQFNLYGHDLRGTLALASKNGQLDLVKWLIERGAPIGAAYDGDMPIIVWLTERFNLHGRELLRDALSSAAGRGDLPLVKYLIEREAPINERSGDEQGLAPIFLAACHGRLDVVKYLVEHGADIAMRDKQGHTIAFFASLGKHYEIVAYLASLEPINHVSSSLVQQTG